ncbi:uncharacterized protein CLUP02_12556 [Colletotrichum lupini]|uniref:Uncharacterized protein n=1 Tax=Colletotrichum lupini TaxID=145971 RepID=A0A9Q8WKT7_9PEZI|nr:uncharacterized protein CLUP02_12556 [Colletotrichum lupini]UQC87054.1 hypothetical protein CLUP02_12556 [Colletotrichum lupini]
MLLEKSLGMYGSRTQAIKGWNWGQSPADFLYYGSLHSTASINYTALPRQTLLVCEPVLTAAPTSVPSAQLRAPLKVTTQLAGGQVLQVFKGPPPSSLASPTIRLLPARRPLLYLACFIATRDLEPLTHCSQYLEKEDIPNVQRRNQATQPTLVRLPSIPQSPVTPEPKQLSRPSTAEADS